MAYASPGKNEPFSTCGKHCPTLWRIAFSLINSSSWWFTEKPCMHPLNGRISYKKKKTKCIKIRNFLKNGNLNFRTNDSGSWTSFSGTPPTYIVLPKLNFLVKFNFSCGIESITKCIVLLSLTNWIYKDITWVNTFN